MASGSGKQAAEVLKSPQDAALVLGQAMTGWQGHGAGDPAARAAYEAVAVALLDALETAAAAGKRKIKELKATTGGGWDVGVFMGDVKAEVQALLKQCEVTQPAPTPAPKKPGGDVQKNRFGDTREAAVHVDKGRADFFSKASCTGETVEVVRAALGTTDWYWVCEACGNGIQKPSKERHKQRCKKLRPEERAEGRYVLQTAEWVLSVVGERNEPFLYMYTMETGLCYDTNAAMRKLAFSGDGGDYGGKADFAYALHRALMRQPKYVGTLFRAMNFRVDGAAYRDGAVVTMPQPTSASTDPQVVKAFLGGGGGEVVGTILILRVDAARDVAAFSVYPEEGEVLIPANSQFRVVGRPDVGVLQLLESALGVDLAGVAVVELQEIDLYHWGCLEGVLTPVERIPNRALLDAIKGLPDAVDFDELHGDDGTEGPDKALQRRHPVTGALNNLDKPVCTLLPTLKDLGLAGFEYDKRLPTGEWCEAGTLLDAVVQTPRNENVLALILANLPLPKYQGAVDRVLESALRLDEAGSHGAAAAVLLAKGAHPAVHESLRTPRLAAIACRCPLPVAERTRAALGGTFWQNEPGTGWTVLHAAAEGDRGDLLEQMLLPAHEVAVDVQDAKGRTPSVVAAEGNCAAALQALRKGGADSTAAAPLLAAAQAGSVAALRLLLEATPVDVKNANGETALLLAARHGQDAALQVLIDAGADVNVYCDVGRDNEDLDDVMPTPLFGAVEHNSAAAVRMLLAAGADVDREAHAGSEFALGTPLYLAAALGSTMIVQQLLDAGAGLSFTDAEGRGVVYLACIHGYFDVVQLLVDAKADVDCRANDGLSALCLSAIRGYADIVHLLLQAGAEPEPEGMLPSPLWAAADGGHVGCVRPFIGTSVDLNQKGSDGLTPCHVCVSHGQDEILAVLLAGGADPNILSDEHYTPLHIAAVSDSNQLSCAQKLIAAKAALDEVTAEGETACFLAAETGLADVLRALIDAGADVHKADVEGTTPLQAAEKASQAEAADILKAAEAR